MADRPPEMGIVFLVCDDRTVRFGNRDIQTIKAAFCRCAIREDKICQELQFQ